MNNVSEICRNHSIDDIIRIYESDMSESARKAEYLKVIKRKELLSGHLLSSLSKKNDNKYKQFFEWTQCKDENYNKYFKLLVKDLVENIDKYEQTYQIIRDKVSKYIYTGILKWRLSRRAKYLVEAYYLSSRNQYFEKFENLTENEIFVDCGAYDGDTYRALLEYIGEGGGKKSFLYEADPKNILEAKIKNGKTKNIIYRNVGVGAKYSIQNFNNTGLSSSAFIGNNAGIPIQIVTLDEDISEKITFLKMDIEGMEMDALIGAVSHIKNDRPVLAICLYHNVQDLWEIPLYIYNLLGDTYSYFVRHYTLYHGETVFYAVPNERYK